MFDWLGFSLRWLHIVAALAAGGGAIFVRFALQPSLNSLPEETRKSLHEQIRSRWMLIVHSAIAVLLLTGAINFLRTRETFISAQGKLPPLYNIVFGIKFLVALVVFFLAIALSGRSQAFAAIRARAKFWLSVNVLLVLIVVGLSGVLRSTHNQPSPETKPGTETSTVPESPSGTK